MTRWKNVGIAACFSLLLSATHALCQQCTQQRNSSGGFVCTKKNAVCGPVTVGIGTKGHCQSQGSGDGQTCECVGQLGFLIRLSPVALLVLQGRSGTIQVNVSPDDGFKGAIALSISSLPSGTSATFNPPSVPGSSATTSTLTITATPTATVGPVVATVTGTSGKITATAQLGLEILTPNAQLWGFADLHTHPASFLGFGSDPNGNNGLFWGNPGKKKKLSDSSTDEAIASDLPACEPDTHNALDPDPVRHATRQQIISSLDQTVPQWSHSPSRPIPASGAPTFDIWPAALSLEHQQMHITEIRRAYDGGLRLLFAAATDNELIDDLWNNGTNLGGNPVPTPTGTSDYQSAQKQLAYIQELVQANSEWMQIVTNSAEARDAIRQNKLAVVLSLELDSLFADQILDLAAQFGVRHVIPVHLSNNTIGGTAVYDDLWNANTFFQTGGFIHVRTNPCISSRLGRPTHLTSGGGGVIQPVPVDAAWFNSLGYNTDITLGGHENDLGLNKNEFMRLMNAGLLLDIVHMGEKSADGALSLGEQFGYPLMDSHTGLRDDTDCSKPAPAGVNERSIPFSQVTRIAKLGGVLGLGTATNNSADAVATWLSKYQEALNLMGGKGVALGTDTNGLSPLLFNNFNKLPTTYPVTVQKSFDAPTEVPTQLPQFKLLSKTYDFATDGLAHYGMLPDFLQAVHDHPALTWSPCMGPCTACAAGCNMAPEGDTNACLQSCQAQFPSPPPTPNPAAPQALQAIYHSAKDVLDMWAKTEAATPTVPVPEGVLCSVFDMGPNGPINIAGPSDAIYVRPLFDNNKILIGRQLCIPGGTIGTCRGFFGMCTTTTTQSAVTFSVFNDGGQDRLGPLTQIFFDKTGQACISGQPAIAPDNTCRKWFGDASTTDQRGVACSVFDDGYASPIGKSSAIFDSVNQGANSSYDLCLPTGGNGVCRRWFGRCIAWPPPGS
jgi:microsomal dipeptidase-like Zn-dependent dipeptidase